MKFFVPFTKPGKAQEMWESIAKVLKTQFKIPISARRIYSLSYIHDKKPYHLQVGELDQQEQRFKVLAIFESKPYIVFTRAASGGPGPIILVSPDEVTAIEDFE